MATQDRNESPAQAATRRRAQALDSTPKEKLAQTITEMDRQCLYYAERIEALAFGVDAILSSEARALPPRHSQHLTRLLEMIRGTSAELANALNWDAEQVGCNHVEELSHV